ncbi:T9SS-dependent choice-of-anchor J family protein [Chryseobacterium sp.]|uniref:T9SS-dependent choice-of-anchor J family protein n=1 Tax=Chryseobacterium sp. TaxID=1871047 RepID=UPI00289F6039|nr:T9SS type A sorting domain-containing protein [Chryseobacterium sp.]
MKKILLLSQMLFGVFMMAQVSYTQDWTASGLNGWTSSQKLFGDVFEDITDPSEICGSSGGTIRGERYYGNAGQLTSPQMTGNNQGQITMSFDYKVLDYSWSGPGSPTASNLIGSISVEYASSLSGPWTAVYTIDENNHTESASCAAKTFTFIPPNSATFYVRFNVISGNSGDSFYYFDNVAISQSAPPTCLQPSGIAASNISSSNALLSWTAPSTVPANGYEVYYSTSSTFPTSTIVLNATNSVTSNTTSANLPNLVANSTYYVWVRSVCSASDKGYWIGALTFNTPCVSTTIPYVQNFDGVTAPSLPSCTTAVNYGLGNIWKTQDISQSSTVPAGFNGNALNYSYNSNEPADTWFFTQGINLTAGVNYRIKYKFSNATGYQYNEKMKVAYGNTNNAAGMTNLLRDYPSVIGGVITNDFVDFTPATTGVYYFGFQAYSDEDMNQIYLDDINIDLKPACSEPSSSSITNLTYNTATLNWSSVSPVPGVGYEYYVSTVNTAPTAGTVTSATSVNLPSVVANTTYYYWIRTNCTTTSNSNWITGTFKTPPVNDNCSNATTLIPGANFAQNSVVGTTFGATLTSDATATTACQTTRYADTWYKVVVPASGSITIETNSDAGSSVTDTVLGVYSGSCGSLVEIGCDDDSSDDGSFSKLSLTSANSITPGETLLIGVWNYSATNNGTFKVSAYDTSLSTSEVVKTKNDIKVYPNPFTDVLNISDIKNVKSISVMDVAGRLVKSFEKPTANLQLSELNSGMYLVVLHMNDGTKQTVKAIKK